MEARVAQLEEIVSDIRSELKTMRQAIEVLTQEVAALKATTLKMQIDLARMDGRVSQMPTLLQLITVVIAIWGMAFATLRFAGH
jgi:Mg2+ and Co2+ transporter CorA